MMLDHIKYKKKLDSLYLKILMSQVSTLIFKRKTLSLLFVKHKELDIVDKHKQRQLSTLQFFKKIFN